MAEVRTYPAAEVVAYLLGIRDEQRARIKQLQVEIGLIESGFEEGDAAGLRQHLRDCEVTGATAIQIWGYLGRMYD
jgi:hypothetical protein